MQSHSEKITAIFAPETQFKADLVSRLASSEPSARRDSSVHVNLAGTQEHPEWRGVRFSALND